jgi:hypothetical protein
MREVNKARGAAKKIKKKIGFSYRKLWIKATGNQAGNRAAFLTERGSFNPALSGQAVCATRNSVKCIMENGGSGASCGRPAISTRT